jgi:hypothetical protein
MQTFVEEHLSFGCDARQLTSLALSESNFSMTVQFDPLGDHAAIFGATAIFAGHLTQGNIVVLI